MKYVSSGQAIEINDDLGYFIPHAVIKPDSKSTQIRIVFNASFGNNDSSLNSLLWKGNVIGLDILPHIIRNRLFKFLIIDDLKKAFLQISIVSEDRKYLRLL